MNLLRRVSLISIIGASTVYYRLGKEKRDTDFKILQRIRQSMFLNVTSTIIFFLKFTNNLISSFRH